MGMSAERLRALLGQVHDELAKTGSVSAEGRELLARTMGELADVLERTQGDSKPPESEGLGDRLEESARQFESEHPQLFTTLQQVIDTLRGAGI